MRRDDVVPLRDAPWVATAMEQWQRSRRLALRGRTPSPRLLRGLLDDPGVAIQQTAWAGDHRPAGLFQVSDVSDRHGTGLLDLLVDPAQAEPLGAALRAFLAEAFATSPLRKLCVWGCEDELALPRYLDGIAHPAGRLAGHDRRGPDHHADMLVHEVWKEAVT